jgi:hypothetical protein
MTRAVRCPHCKRLVAPGAYTGFTLAIAPRHSMFRCEDHDPDFAYEVEENERARVCPGSLLAGKVEDLGRTVRGHIRRSPLVKA